MAFEPTPKAHQRLVAILAPMAGVRWRARQVSAFAALGLLGLCLVVLAPPAGGTQPLHGGAGLMPMPAAALGALLSLALGLGIGLAVRHQESGKILEQLAFERERKVLAERSEHLMRHASDMILLTDLDGRILETNVAASDHFGYDQGEFRDRVLADLRAPEMAAQVRERFQQLKSAGSARFESVFRHKDGTEIPAEVSARVIALGEDTLVLHFIRDSSERRAALAALRASEASLAKAFATSPDAININRFADGVFLSVNPSFTTLTGFSAEEVLGRDAKACGIWADPADRERLIAGLREHGQVVGFEAPFLAKDGRRIHGLMSAAILEIDDTPCILSITRDITRMIEDRQALLESERLLREAQTAGKVGTYVWEFRKRGWEGSATLRAILGIPGTYPRTLWRWLGLVPPACRAEQKRRLQSLVPADRILEFECPIIRPVDHQERWVHLRGEIERDADGRPLRVVGIIQDLTERKQAEEDRRQLEARLHQAQKLESMGSLAGGVAHDMNNVLGAILSLASARREGLDPHSPMASSLDTIANACLRGRGVVRSLLYFARKDLDETKPLDLNLLVREVVQLLGSTTLKRIRLETELQEPLSPVMGDGGALSHALMNLCVNALDAMPGKGTLRLRTETLPDGRVRVAVQDTGPGMTREVLAKAVEPFYSTKPQGQGTGLGLAMVFGTVKAHGGDLVINSCPGSGTEVILTFPARSSGPAQQAEGPDDPRAATGGPLNILVVDDDELIRESLVPMLEIMGHGVQAAPGGLDALALMNGGLEVDLVILDMNMPGINGAETLARIKALRPAQAVLMSSGYNDSEVSALVGGYPGVACIQKPFSMNELRTKLAGMAV